MPNKQLTQSEVSDLLESLQKIQQMQSEINAQKSRPLTGEEVKQRVSRSDYGLCIDNPIILNNIPLAAKFLENIKSPAGTPFINEKRSPVQGRDGHIVDVYNGYYLKKNGERIETKFYVDCYCSRSVPVPPSGWFGKNEKMPKKSDV